MPVGKKDLISDIHHKNYNPIAVAKLFTKFYFKPMTLKSQSCTSQGNDSSSVPYKTSNYLLLPSGLKFELDELRYNKYEPPYEDSHQ